MNESAPTAVDEAEDARRHAARMAALAKKHQAKAPADLEEVPGPTFWPDLTPKESPKAWAELRQWVEGLCERFPHLDHHVVPGCWFRHPGYVELLAALRDAEYASYNSNAPRTAPIEWHRAFQFAEARLSEWTAQFTCGATHEERPRYPWSINESEWEQFVADDTRDRSERPIRETFAKPGQ
jgi:hypothetical protein